MARFAFDGVIPENEIGDVGARALADTLKVNSTLRLLNLGRMYLRVLGPRNCVVCTFAVSF